MKRLVVLGFCLVAGAELLMLLLHQRRFVLVAAGAAAALLLLGFRRLLGREVEPLPASADYSAAESLRHWVSRTEIMIHWSESNRTDWDRHWRPVLARRFENATGQARRKDPAAFDATGRMLFGPELWEWVDPANVADGRAGKPGPGRTVLEDILQRLEQA